MKRRCHAKAAFSLVEIAVALGIASFSLISIMSMLLVGIGSAQNATTQTGAMNILSSIAADIRITPTGGTSASPRFGINPTSTAAQTLYFTEAGTASSTPTQTSLYKAVIREVPFSTATPTVNGTIDHVVVSWPALASSNTMGSIEVMISLPQN